MPLRHCVRNSGWMHMSLSVQVWGIAYRARSVRARVGQSMEMQGTRSLAVLDWPLAKWPQPSYASVTHSLLRFSYCPGNPSPTSEKVNCPQRRIPNILLQFWNTMGKSKRVTSESGQGSHKKGKTLTSLWVFTVALVRWPQRFGLVTHCLP